MHQTATAGRLRGLAGYALFSSNHSNIFSFNQRYAGFKLYEFILYSEFFLNALALGCSIKPGKNPLSKLLGLDMMGI